MSDLSPGHVERQLEATRKVHAELRKRLLAEKDPRVKQDLEILIKAAANMIRGTELAERLEVPYMSLPELMFQSFHGLLDEQVSPARRPSALVRLRKYTGMEPGTKPITEHAMALVRERLNSGKLLPPVRSKVEKDLAQSSFFVAGVGKLLQQFQIKGHEEPYSRLRDQLAAWDQFVKTEVLPKARQDFRLPPELYAFQLEQIGIDIPPDQLAAKAHKAFTEIQGQLGEVAAKVAKEQNLPSSDYRDVIKALKTRALVGDAILAHYQKRLKEIEEVIRAEKILTLARSPGEDPAGDRGGERGDARARTCSRPGSSATPARSASSSSRSTCPTPRER